MTKHVSLAVMSLLFAMAMCIGCGEQQIDTSSDKAYVESLKIVYESVPEEGRKEFRKNLHRVLSEKARFGGGTLSESDMYIIYNIAVGLGNDKEREAVLALNGLTASEITQRGEAIGAEKDKRDQERRKKQLEADIAKLNESIDFLEKVVVSNKKFTEAVGQVEVTATGVEALEAKREAGSTQNSGRVGYFVALVTIKNNSSEVVQSVGGKITIADEAGEKIETKYLSTIEAADGYTISNKIDKHLNIAPGAEWRGKVFFKMYRIDKKHPYPLTQKYIATLSDVKVVLIGDTNEGSMSTEEIVENLAHGKDTLMKMEKELALIK